MRLKIKTVMDGPGPSESVVAIKTASDRNEELVVSNSQIKENTIEVGHVGDDRDSVLVELPRESASGNWRLWVPSHEVG